MNNSTSNKMPFPSQLIVLNTEEKVFRVLCPQDPDMVLDSITEKDKFLPLLG